MKKLILISIAVLFATLFKLQAQAVSREVFSTAGNTETQVGNMYINYTIGEPIVGTASAGAMIYTQGFQQPYRKKAGSYSYSEKNETCPGAKDGQIQIFVDSTYGGPYSIVWTDGNLSLKRDSLSAGQYIFTLTTGQSASIDTITVGLDSEDSCGLTIYSGFTPNGDGINDVWHIDGKAAYMPNSVNIFNRWGVKVWNKSNYDNGKVVWDGKSNGGAALPDGTYFYIIKANKKVYKGWVNITR